eukprot:TRINITY_DN14965_c0_g1_i2.p1 TRINITY_DN14965_c0_g1~~TRINITY_DN14965_c0_g1_i2.p1  ORF type:complete len:109 (+),score=12.52 TRINITY_DN14965_c0_g1_i2:49-375(+)
MHIADLVLTAIKLKTNHIMNPKMKYDIASNSPLKPKAISRKRINTDEILKIKSLILPKVKERQCSSSFDDSPSFKKKRREVLIIQLSLIHICRCRRSTLCRSRWSPYH